MPLLVVHGTADSVIPVESAQRFADARPAGTRVVLVDGAKHSFEDARSAAALVEAVVVWLADALPE